MDEQPTAADLDKALEKIRAVHSSIRIRGLLRWTLSDIPDYAEEPYVMMAAHLAAPEFEAPPNPSAYAQGFSDICAAANLPAFTPTQAEYF